MSYIKRKDALTDAMCVGISCQECPFLINPIIGGCKVENYIKSIPAADVVERKVGKWTNKRTLQHDGEWYCSRCQFEPYYSRDIHTLNFCPNCGADMRED